ncbi:type II toxin-antitoxin system RelE/ParE family toxin [Xenorhabdus sp. KJ12.1]|uniref:type II toxin-antitoxin system RelE/ParE family toxin n=1 Tax=Xenorhabdus sp. KJ12.1 TaxID=1851571 RepID=UPI000C0412B9|nr:type II toxin-antitoxin system RelE/ParE family toxin [Xenorhabdus sp. KJ12.1]PHM66585.1 toxin RelE [Xenorhabdus sp. KJ12.1]
MAFYKISSFKKSTKKINISDQQLLNAAQEVKNGKFEADLGSGVIKKRIAIGGKGKSGGVRVIIFFKVNNHLFFADGWTKSTISSKGKKEIEDDELEAYKQLSKLFLSYTDQKINELITHGILEEIIYE